MKSDCDVLVEKVPKLVDVFTEKTRFDYRWGLVLMNFGFCLFQFALDLKNNAGNFYYYCVTKTYL